MTAETSTFPDISQVNEVTCSKLVSCFKGKVACFKAGRLKFFHEEWKSLTSDAEILDMVSGQMLEFSQKPCQFYTVGSRSEDSDSMQTCHLEIQSLLEKRAIVPCEHENGEYICPIFTTSKKDGSSRMILNLKGLNTFLEYHHFKMESFSTIVSLIKSNCFMSSIDLKDAYYSVPIALERQKYLKFEWNKQL